MPLTTTGSDPLLAQQQTRVSGLLQQRLTKASGVTLATAAVSDLLGIFQTIFAKDFVVLPQFTPPNLATLQSAFGQSSALVSSDPQAPARWFRQSTVHARGASRLDLALARGAGPERRQALSANLDVCPARRRKRRRRIRWLALLHQSVNPPQKGRDCSRSHRKRRSGFSANTSTLALLIEEWLERIPGTQASTAVAFPFPL